MQDSRHTFDATDETLAVSKIETILKERGISMRGISLKAGAKEGELGFAIRHKRPLKSDTLINILRALGFDFIDIRKPQTPTT